MRVPGIRQRLSRVSVKTRISLWFTLVLAAVCALLLVVSAAAYAGYGKKAARDELLEAVCEEAALLEEDRGFLARLDAGLVGDADFAVGNAQIAVYDEDGGRYAGLFLYEGLDDVPFTASEQVRSITLDGTEYYCYDERVRVPHGKDLWVRGVMRSEVPVWDTLGRSGFLVWLVPVLLAVAFFGGRLLAGRMLRPVGQIAATARDIRASGDLSRRVPQSGSGDELSALAEDMNGMFDALERNFRAERSFTSSASHELRTPIAVILAECEYARDNASGEEELRQSLAAVQRQGAKMSCIVDALLMLTRMEQGTDRYALEPTDLGMLVGHACDDFAALAPDAVVERQIAEGVSAVANRELVALAVDNLLRNAARYGGAGVKVRVGLSCSDGTARITVADNGPGIPAELCERVWELFFRADDSRSTEGLGVGLALVRRIAEYHGGAARVSSAAGQGAAFAIELPLAGPRAR